MLRLGAVAVPLDTAYKAAQVATLMKDSGARVMFTSERHLATVLEGRQLSGRADMTVVLLHGATAEVASFEAFATPADGACRRFRPALPGRGTPR